MSAIKLESFKEVFFYIRKSITFQNKKIQKIGYPLMIRRFTVKILWACFIFYLMTSLTTTILFSIAASLGLLAIVEVLANIFDDGIKHFVYGKFFDNFSSGLLNKCILILIILYLFVYFQQLTSNIYKDKSVKNNE